jgi:hypothetical protein
LNPQSDPLAIASTVLGGMSLLMCFCCGVLGSPVPIAAIVCGAMSLSRQSKEPDRFSATSKPLAVTGIALGAISLVLMAVALALGMGARVLEALNT